MSTLARDHPLVGKIWNIRLGRWMTETELVSELRAATYVLLGEKHDNADHHRLQARLVTALAAGEPRRAVAFEMIDVDRQPRIDEALARGVDPDGLALAVEWEERWRSWELYRPVVRAALDQGLPIVAANFPREDARRAVREGLDSLDPTVVSRLGLDVPLDDAIRAVMVEELRQAHCGHLPGGMADAMVLAQRARDAQMAERLISTHTRAGVVLIAGAGHTRTDRGVPALIRSHEPGASILSLAFIEVVAELNTPREYAALYGSGELPFDAVWFTPRVTDDDPCEAFGQPHHRSE